MIEYSYKKTLKEGVAIVLAGGIVVVAAGAAHAGGFALREQSAVGQGASFAGVAAGSGLSSMFWNPATLTQVGGMNTESVLSGIAPSTDVKNISTTPAGLAALGNPGDVGLAAVIPSSYSGVQLTNDLFVGLSINAPYGLATKAKNLSATSFHAATAKIFTTDVKANIAYRINDVFSVGAGVGVTYGKVRMTAASPTVGHELQGDDWAPTFSLGATITPMEGTTIGLGYRSETTLNLEGTEYFTTAGRTPIKAKMVLPSTVTVGLKQRVNEKFALLAGFEWSNWSTLKDPVPIRGSVAGTALTLGYEDAWYASIGGEYYHNDQLTLRAGLGFEKSPIPDAHRNLRLPDANRVWASIGASFDVTEELSVDIGYSHLFVKDDVPVSGSAGGASYSATADSSVDILSASLRYQWKPEPLFADDDPIVRKY